MSAGRNMKWWAWSRWSWPASKKALKKKTLLSQRKKRSKNEPSRPGGDNRVEPACIWSVFRRAAGLVHFLRGVGPEHRHTHRVRHGVERGIPGRSECHGFFAE